MLALLDFCQLKLEEPIQARVGVDGQYAALEEPRSACFLRCFARTPSSLPRCSTSSTPAAHFHAACDVKSPFLTPSILYQPLPWTTPLYSHRPTATLLSQTPLLITGPFGLPLLTNFLYLALTANASSTFLSPSSSSHLSIILSEDAQLEVVGGHDASTPDEAKKTTVLQRHQSSAYASSPYLFLFLFLHRLSTMSSGYPGRLLLHHNRERLYPSHTPVPPDQHVDSRQLFPRRWSGEGEGEGASSRIVTAHSPESATVHALASMLVSPVVYEFTRQTQSLKMFGEGYEVDWDVLVSYGAVNVSTVATADHIVDADAEEDEQKMGRMMRTTSPEMSHRSPIFHFYLV
ncbi:hypothetical protein D9758_006987 [Tetrapyrgos nigripes]|uniref:Uncharacterized protein n=1 Tax=Tetrapyrgos nigripes TaxID=182062 RepID=A0A8H5GSF7_9AGAR|nr:hypothetical protein D9758_006987 [Tetrapyrgos nigripes]